MIMFLLLELVDDYTFTGKMIIFKITTETAVTKSQRYTAINACMTEDY